MVGLEREQQVDRQGAGAEGGHDGQQPDHVGPALGHGGYEGGAEERDPDDEGQDGAHGGLGGQDEAHPTSTRATT